MKTNNDINKAKTVAVKIIDSCLIRQMHLEAGLTFEMAEPDAYDIQCSGRGVVVRVRPSISAPAMPQLMPAA